MTAGRVIPGSKHVVATIVNGPNPLTVAMVGALDAARGLGLAGLLGTRIFGMHGGAYNGGSFRGDCGPQQSFRGFAGPMVNNLRTGAPMSLPITATGITAILQSASS
jgi:hypothetical protein